MKVDTSRAGGAMTAVDLFCGAGGLTRGLLDAGIHVAAGYDIDPACAYAYEHNNAGVKFHQESVVGLSGNKLAQHYPDGHLKILVGCAPCQTFSKYTQRYDNAEDPKWNLLGEFGRIVRELKPDIVSMENVPELQRYPIFQRFLETLRDEGFHFQSDPKKLVVYCPDYGLPQHRSRLVLIASRLGPIELMPPTHTPDTYVTVAQAIGGLPPIEAGEACPSDPLHRSSRLSPLNRRRIRKSKPGGTWRDWPEDLVAECHRKETGRSYPGVYSRMEWDKPSPTITTQFFGFGNGRFGHPKQNRAISLREGALLQSFPSNYRFARDGSTISIRTTGRLIGNAVPVRVGTVIGSTIIAHERKIHDTRQHVRLK